LVPIEWSTRDSGIKNHRADIAEDLANGKDILLVDDINDTGRTFIELIDDWGYNEQLAGVLGTLTTATVFQRYNTQHPSNYHMVLIEDDSWIVFPWES
jgi:hypoxanthine phosphoribosyltransferase